MVMRYLLHGEESERLHFRHIESDDFEQWLPFFEDPDSFRYWRPLEKPPREECREWYAHQLDRYKNDHGGMNALIETETGRLIGHAGILQQRVDGKEPLEVAYSLLNEFRGKGYATEAAIHCRDVAFRNNWADELISIISLPNKPSMNVARKNGMHPGHETLYKGVAVNIFSIKREQWLAQRDDQNQVSVD